MFIDEDSIYIFLSSFVSFKFVKSEYFFISVKYLIKYLSDLMRTMIINKRNLTKIIVIKEICHFGFNQIVAKLM